VASTSPIYQTKQEPHVVAHSQGGVGLPCNQPTARHEDDWRLRYQVPQPSLPALAKPLGSAPHVLLGRDMRLPRTFSVSNTSCSALATARRPPVQCFRRGPRHSTMRPTSTASTPWPSAVARQAFITASTSSSDTAAWCRSLGSTHAHGPQSWGFGRHTQRDSRLAFRHKIDWWRADPRTVCERCHLRREARPATFAALHIAISMQ
jgi:hypothetical protein